MWCNEQTKTPSESQNYIFLWLRPWFNSNVDTIIKNLFCEHAFCQASFGTPKQSNFCLLCHYIDQSNWGSLRVMARISLAIRDIVKNLWRNRFRCRRNFPCISSEYSEAPRFLKAKSSAAENSAAIFRRRRFSLTIQILFLHFYYFHQSNFYSHYSIYASLYGSFRIRVSLVIKNIFRRRSNFSCACGGIFRRRSTML